MQGPPVLRAGLSYRKHPAPYRGRRGTGRAGAGLPQQGLHLSFPVFLRKLDKNKAASPERAGGSAGCPSQGSMLPERTMRQVSELQ